MISFKTRDRDDPKYSPKRSNAQAGRAPFRLVKRKGNTYSVAGEMVELFTISVLAEAMDRKTISLMKWEKEGLLPRPLFRLPNKKTRVYSAAQVMNLHLLMWAKYDCRKNQTLPRKEFFDDLKAVFYKRKQVVSADGVIDDDE